MLLGFEHVGMTSSDPDRTIAFYCDLLGLGLALRKPANGGELLFLDAGGGMLEIFCRSDAGSASDVPPTQAGMRHLTFAFDNIDPLIGQLEAAGVEIVERPRAAINTEMLRRVAFVRDPDGILVELAERSPSRLAAGS